MRKLHPEFEIDIWEILTLCIVSNKKGDIFRKYLGIKINSFTKGKENLFTTMPKILAVVCNAFDERFGASLWRHGSNKCYLCKL